MNNDKFYCPYAVDRCETLENVSVADEDGTNHLTQRFYNKASFVECKREQCGVFYDGRCHYNGTR